MKTNLTVSLAIACLLALSSCDFLSVFGGDDQPQRQAEGADTPKLSVEITGGFAGVLQNLTVDPDGKARYVDSLRPGEKWVVQFDSERLARIDALFLENNYFELGDNYLNPELADAFIYTISFRNQGEINTVTTDGYEDPENLTRIVEGIRELVTDVTENGLDLELKLSTNEMQAGDTVEMTLIAKNVSEQVLELDFTSGQSFDFYAGPNLASSFGLDRRGLVWNWSHDKAFTQVLRHESLAVGESKSYRISWDGRDNRGNQIIGTFQVGAELVSIPGGSPAAQTLTITEAQ